MKDKGDVIAILFVGASMAILIGSLIARCFPVLPAVLP